MGASRCVRDSGAGVNTGAPGSMHRCAPRAESLTSVLQNSADGCRIAKGVIAMKRIRLTVHALEQCAERGATEDEVKQAIQNGAREAAKHGRALCRFNFPYNRSWQGKLYAIKQVASVIKEEPDEIVVITVYTFYF